VPVTKSAQKAMRGSARKRAVNLVTIKKYKDAVKAVRKAVSTGKLDEAKKLLSSAYKQMDKAVKKNVVHKNKASRLKSRLSRATKVAK